MKTLPSVLTFAVLFGFTNFMNAQKNPEEQAVRRVVADFVEALNRNDMKVFGGLFTKDADFVVVTGKYLKGRDDIVTYHAGLEVAGDFKGSHLEAISVALRFLRPDVALVRAATRRTEDAGKWTRTSFPMFVLTKQGREWLITAVQNTATSGAPPTPVGSPR